MDGSEEISDDEILSRAVEGSCPSGDPVAQQAEAKAIYVEWLRNLTEQEKTAVKLKVELDSEEEIAGKMRISQQRVSQLIRQALKKWQKFSL